MKGTLVACFCLLLVQTGRSQSSPREIVDVREWMPDVRIQAPYATSDNFTDQKLYGVDTRVAYGALGAIQALRRVRADLRAAGYDLLIWDFYRPLTVQWVMWSILPDPNFVADPRNGSNHNRGAAVDVSLVDPATGEPMDMGSGFDEFTERAEYFYPGIDPEVQTRRRLLRDTFDFHNFSPYSLEWWHFTHNLSTGYPLRSAQMK